MPHQSMIYLLLCLSGVMTFVFLGLFPAQRILAGLDVKISENRLRLEEQKTLMPIYQILKQRTRKNANKILPLPRRTELPREKMNLLNTQFNEIAKQTNVEVASLAPSLTALASSSKYLTIEASLRGDFFSFRKFLIGLGAIPYMEHLEEIQVRENSEGREMKIKFAIVRS